ncbi:MAG: CDP-alcohol phosphatidyltransferase family protein [Gammaproteobacteria bacterium]
MPASAPELLRELRRTAALGGGLLLAMAFSLSALAEASYALRWLLPGTATWGLVVWQCRSRLHKNYSTEDGTAYSQLGLGNRITLLRGLLIAATAGFLATAGITTHSLLLFVPAALYTAAALGDALDGYLARRQGQTTLLGRELDTALDALGLLVAPLLAILTGKLHFSYLLVSFAYYLFKGGIHWRQRHNRPVYALPPSRLRRQLAGFQMGLVAAALWPPLPAELTRPAGLLFMLPLLIGFVRDWLYVSGRLGNNQEPPL